MEDSGLSDKKAAPEKFVINEMDADLGLFNQLLQMVDGDWSDSIQGICSHILAKFNALGIILVVYDKLFNEFIFIEYATSDDINLILQNNNIKLSHNIISSLVKKIYSVKKDILEFRVFNKNDIRNMAEIYFNDNNATRLFLEKSRLNTVMSIPVLETNSNFNCSILILSEKEIIIAANEPFNGYLRQLNIAMEIVFLVRELYIKATHDSLTKLFNHKQGMILLRRELDRVMRNKNPLTIVMLDIDFFKKVNDTYGHQAGDAVLEYIATLLSASMRKCDIISRYGGEEFLIVLPDTGLNNSVDVIKRMKDTIQDHRFIHGGNEFSVTASFGMTQFDGSMHPDISDIIEDADSKLYRAKHNGRNRIEY